MHHPIRELGRELLPILRSESVAIVSTVVSTVAALLVICYQVKSKSVLEHHTHLEQSASYDDRLEERIGFLIAACNFYCQLQEESPE